MTSQRKDLRKILHAHSLWVLSERKKGRMANFDGWNLDGVILELANLPFARFQSASLKAAFLEGINLRQAKLMRANLSEARLAGADFEGAEISGADLSFVECEGANFTNANLVEVNFQGANLDETCFKGANLRRANFKNAVLSYAEMNGADIEGAKFDGAKIVGTDFKGTALERIHLEKTSFEGTHPRDFVLEPAKPQSVNLDEEDFFNLIMNEEESPNAGAAKHYFEKSNSNQRPLTKESKKNLSVDSNFINQKRVADAVGDLIKKVNSSIDPNQVIAICKSRYGIEKIDKIDFEGGDIVARNGQVTFQLNFKISHKLTIFIDRHGNIKIPFPKR